MGLIAVAWVVPLFRTMISNLSTGWRALSLRRRALEQEVPF